TSKESERLAPDTLNETLPFPENFSQPDLLFQPFEPFLPVNHISPSAPLIAKSYLSTRPVIAEIIFLHPILMASLYKYIK
ncbi:MAG: hypothetical protein ACI395_00405, partial [Candidatus Cryptobacteroides sp.]